MGLIAGVQEHYSIAKRTFEQIRFSDPTFFDSLVDLGLAIATFGLEDYLTARQHLQAGLIFAFDSKQRIAMNWYLPVATIFMAHEGHYEQAVELLALAYHHPSSTTGWLDKWQLLQQVRTDLEAELGADVFESAWERGKNSDLDEAVIRLLGWLNNETPSESNTIDHANQRLIEPLTPRELETVQLIVSGLDNREISEKLFISIPTVKKHINHIFSKLGVNSRAKAIVRARDLHINT
jgi:DNA-binding CsgD family transcriptional regulator